MAGKSKSKGKSSKRKPQPSSSSGTSSSAASKSSLPDIPFWNGGRTTVSKSAPPRPRAPIYSLGPNKAFIGDATSRRPFVHFRKALLARSLRAPGSGDEDGVLTRMSKLMIRSDEEDDEIIRRVIQQQSDPAVGEFNEKYMKGYDIINMQFQYSHLIPGETNVFDFEQAKANQDTEEILSAPTPIEGENLAEIFPDDELAQEKGNDIRRRGDWATHVCSVPFCPNHCMAWYSERDVPPKFPCCGTPRLDKNSFTYNSIRERVRFWYSVPSLAQVLKRHKHHNEDPTIIKDYFDGDNFKQVKQSQRRMHRFGNIKDAASSQHYFENENELAFHLFLSPGFDQINFDGFYTTAWAVCLNLPIEERYRPENIHTFFFAPNVYLTSQQSGKQDWNTFFQPFFDDQSEASFTGYTVYDASTKTNVTVRHHIVGINGDPETFEDVLKIASRYSMCPCVKCKASYTLESLLPGYRGGPHSRGLSLYGFPNSPYDPIRPPNTRRDMSPRTSDELRAQIRAAMREGRDNMSEAFLRTGVEKGLSLFFLDSFKVETGFPPDLHCNRLQNMEMIMDALFVNFRGGSSFLLPRSEIPLFCELLTGFNNTVSQQWVGVKFNVLDLQKSIKNKLQHRLKSSQSRCIVDILVAFSDYGTLNPQFKQLLLELCFFYKVVQMSEFSRDFLDDMEKGLYKFHRAFEEIVIANKPSNLSYLAEAIHDLLHFPAGLRNFGPLGNSWAVPINKFAIITEQISEKSRVRLRDADKLVATNAEYTNELFMNCTMRFGAKHRWMTEFIQYVNIIKSGAPYQSCVRAVRQHIISAYPSVVDQYPGPSIDLVMSFSYYGNVFFDNSGVLLSPGDIVRFVDGPLDQYTPTVFAKAVAFVSLDKTESSDLIDAGVPGDFTLIRRFKRDVVKPKTLDLKYLQFRDCPSNCVTTGFYIEHSGADLEDASLYEEGYDIIPTNRLNGPGYFVSNTKGRFYSFDTSFIMSYVDQTDKRATFEIYRKGNSFNPLRLEYSKYDERAFVAEELDYITGGKEVE